MIQRSFVRGRFDLSVEVGYPNAEEVLAALNSMIADRGTLPNLGHIASKLSGRPMSDVAWVANEAARIAARARKNEIDEIDFLAALKRIAV